MKNILMLSMSVLVLANFACSPTSPRRQPPLEEFKQLSLTPQIEKLEANNKVDILFVIDVSASMAKHQQTLADNIENFVKVFARNKVIDFHIGVTSIYDSTKPQSVGPVGHLQPLKFGPNPDQVIPGVPFVTRKTPKLVETLKNTILMGAKDPKTGPEFEESFSPVVAAISDSNALLANQGFYRPDAYLAVIFITDADISNRDFNPEEFNRLLLNAKAKKRQKIMTFGVLAIPVDGVVCKTDPSGPPVKLKHFMEMSQGLTFSLCSPSFGRNLAKIGVQLDDRLSRREQLLTGIPDADSLVVLYGKESTPLNERKLVPPVSIKGERIWSYDSDLNAIIFHRDLDEKLMKEFKITDEPGAAFGVSYIPVKLINTDNGNTEIK
ncbi:MAG: hypothetical protein SGI74_10765 [Oligoflexia bacterium]|nr:hypothetical protein [Oligoflexia bacterium]